MSQKVSANGNCLCGSVKVKTSSMDPNLGACHCGMCRKWSSGPFLAVGCSSDLEIEGDEFVTTYNSSEWADRAFCKNCGTNLFYKLKNGPQYIVSAGIFENQDYNFDHQIFIDQKPGFYDFKNETKNMTGEEVFAAFS